MFYKFRQSNSGGMFVVDDKVCHILIIEADNVDEAINCAFELGVYFDGVSKGIDCPCCGDRWREPDVVDLENSKYVNPGLYINYYPKYEKIFDALYSDYNILKGPSVENADKSYASYTAYILCKDVRDYAQIEADNTDGTSPEVRVFYKNGTMEEFYHRKLSEAI